MLRKLQHSLFNVSSVVVSCFDKVLSINTNHNNYTYIVSAILSGNSIDGLMFISDVNSTKHLCCFIYFMSSIFNDYKQN